MLTVSTLHLEFLYLPGAAQHNNKILVSNQKWYFNHYPLRNCLIQEFNHLFLGGQPGVPESFMLVVVFLCCDFKLYLMGHLKGECCHLGERS